MTEYLLPPYLTVGGREAFQNAIQTYVRELAKELDRLEDQLASAHQRLARSPRHTYIVAPLRAKVDRILKRVIEVKAALLGLVTLQRSLHVTTRPLPPHGRSGNRTGRALGTALCLMRA